MLITNYHAIEIDDDLLANYDAILIGYFEQENDAYAVSFELCGGLTLKIEPTTVTEIDFTQVDYVEEPSYVGIF